MPFFSKIKGAKKAADAKKAQEAGETPAVTPYRHVPTHAMVDALGGAPPSGRDADRAAIKAAHLKRKSTMSPQNSTPSTVAMLQDSMQLGEDKSSSPDQRRPRLRGRAPSRPSSQFQSFQSLAIPEGEVSQFSSQYPSPGHSPASSTSSRRSYLEMPVHNTEQTPTTTTMATSAAAAAAAPPPPPPPSASSSTPTATRKLGEAPRLSAPPPRPSATSNKKSDPSTSTSSPPAKKRKSWIPFAGSNKTQTQTQPVAVAAH